MGEGCKQSGKLPFIVLDGMKVNKITERQCIDYITSNLQEKIGGWVITPNLDHLYRFQHDSEFRAFYDRATIIVPDGMPLVWASRIQRTPLPERIAGSSLVYQLAENAASNEMRLFLLGGAGDSAQKASDRLQEIYAGLDMCGTYSPPLGFEKEDDFMDPIVKAIVRCRPNLVYVGLGSPKQEMVIQKLIERFPNIWFLGIGVSLSFISGDIKRSPKWIQRIGMEWFYRLIHEPNRLFKRYIVHDLPYFIKLMIKSLFKRYGSFQSKHKE